MRSESEVPAERSIPPDIMTTACPIVSKIKGVNALIFLTTDLISKKFFCSTAVITSIMTNMITIENSGLKINFFKLEIPIALLFFFNYPISFFLFDPQGSSSYYIIVNIVPLKSCYYLSLIHYQEPVAVFYQFHIIAGV